MEAMPALPGPRSWAGRRRCFSPGTRRPASRTRTTGPCSPGRTSSRNGRWTAEASARHYLSHRFPLVDARATAGAWASSPRTSRSARWPTRPLLQSQKLESLGVLAGGIAHDFNNLLGAILGNLDLALMAQAPGAGARATWRRHRASWSKATDLTRQMLAYAGPGAVPGQALDLNRLVEEMAQLLRDLHLQEGGVRYDLAAGLPPSRPTPPSSSRWS